VRPCVQQLDNAAWRQAAVCTPRSQNRDLGHPTAGNKKPIEYLHKLSAHQVEGLLNREFADSRAVASECVLDGLGFMGVGDGYVDEAYGSAQNAERMGPPD